MVTCGNRLHRRPPPQMAKTTIVMPRVLSTNVAPTSRLEHLPIEMVFLIANKLVGEARIALALTSRTMMSVLGPSTLNVAHCRQNGRWAVSFQKLYRRESLLELLERDSPVLVVCDTCAHLHSFLPLPRLPLDGDESNRMACQDPEERLDLSGTNVTLTQPFIRKVVLLHRAGYDVSPHLGLLACTTPNRPRRGAYHFVMDDQARAVDSSLLLRRQLFVTRGSPFRGGTPSVRDLLSLWSVLRSAHLPSWESQLDLDRSLLGGLAAPASCKTRHLRAEPSAHVAACYPDDAVPPPGALAPSWQCLLSHPVPCCCPLEGTFKGHVGGEDAWFMDHCISVLPAPQCGWGRVLVFTAWRDLGDTIWRSADEPNEWKWVEHPGRLTAGSPSPTTRERMQSRPGDVYEKYEDAAEGTVAYMPELPQHVAERLFGLELKD